MKALTPAQRQADFRQRHSTIKSRINSLVSNEAKLNLSVLAYHFGKTETAMLETLVSDAINKL